MEHQNNINSIYDVSNLRIEHSISFVSAPLIVQNFWTGVSLNILKNSWRRINVCSILTSLVLETLMTLISLVVLTHSFCMVKNCTFCGNPLVYCKNYANNTLSLKFWKLETYHWTSKLQFFSDFSVIWINFRYPKTVSWRSESKPENKRKNIELDAKLRPRSCYAQTWM